MLATTSLFLQIISAVPLTDKDGKVWKCDNAFYQKLAPVEWQRECAGIVLPIRPPPTRKSQGPVRMKDGPVQFPKDNSKQGSKERPLTPEEEEAAMKLEKRVKRYLPVELDVDTSYLNNTQEQVLESLINAASCMDDIFESQVWKGSKAKKEQLENEMSWNKLARLQMQYWNIMKGPWDRTDENKPFAIDRQKPDGAGFYSEDLSYKEFKVWMQLHPDQRQALESPVTIVKRIEQAAQYPVPLEAVPYSEEYKDHLNKSADFLKEAADKTDNPSLAKFLRARAQAFMDNEYGESDRLWLDVDSRVQIAIGPYEVKEDSLAGLKAAFEAFVYVSDQKFEFTSNRLRSLLPESQDALESSWANTAELEKNLPIPEELKNQEVLTRQLTGVRPTIHIGELLFASGDAMKDVITFAFDLPKDNKVRNEKGSRKVIMRNVVFAKFDAILAPMAVKIMKEKQIPLLSNDAFFLNILYNQISRSLGPKYVGNDESKGEISKVLGSSAAAIEEAKADVMGVWNMLYKFNNGDLPADLRNKVLFTYITSLLRSVRFGTDSSQGLAAAVQLNQYLEENAIIQLDQKAGKDQGKFQVNFKKLENSVKDRVKEYVTMQHSGDKEAVEKLLAKYGVVSERMRSTLANVEDVPVDIRPIFQKDY